MFEQRISELDRVMTEDVVCIDMDFTLLKAIELCSEKRIRHLPVLDEDNRLVGIVTDRDLRYFLSPRLGTISENNSDRESLSRHVHQMMVRKVVCCHDRHDVVRSSSIDAGESGRLFARCEQ